MFIKFKNIIIYSVIFFTLFSAGNIDAATLSISPNTSTVSVGNIISLKILVNTDSKFINNGEATIQFPTELLEVISVTKSSSIFTLWVEEPSFSNVAGKITFNGGIPTPGYNGQGGYIATVTFKTKKQGVASVVFTDGAVRENDGLGTDILTTRNSGVVQIGAIKEIEVPITPTIVDNKNMLPPQPVIISETHPDQDLWYKENTATFNWKIPNTVTSLKTLFNKTANSNPAINYDNSVTEKTLKSISDGISYFHLRYYNSFGGSIVSHYKVKIDSTPPLSFVPAIRTNNGYNVIKLEAEDETSGIDYYEIKIDEDVLLEIKNDDVLDNEFTLPVLSEGKHSLVVIAYDKAGNKREENLSFSSPSILPPSLTLGSQEITSGDSVDIQGESIYPNEKVNIILELEGVEIGRYIQMTDNNGNFFVTTDKIKTIGTINIYAEVLFSDLVKSSPSQKVYLKVSETEAVKVTLSIILPLLYIIVIIIILLILFMILYLGWHKYFGLKKKIEDETKKTTIEIHKAMVLLKEELNNHLESFKCVKQGGSLGEKEESIHTEIQKNIDVIDDFIEKKIKKIIK